MQLSTTARNCLYVNWALPLEAAPRLPRPLRYEVHGKEGEEHVFLSALLFRLEGLRFQSLPYLRVSYPQMNLRLYVLDREGMPSVLFLRTFAPFWVAPVSFLLGRQPVTAARLSGPRAWIAPPLGEDGCWEWRVRRRGWLRLVARPGSPLLGPGPSLGSFEATVSYFRRRPRGYALGRRRLRTVVSSQPRAEVVPVELELPTTTLLEGCVPGLEEDFWQRPHSAWLCPEIPFIFELGRLLPRPVTGRPVPAPRGV
jgi:hypothetical protein